MTPNRLNSTRRSESSSDVVKALERKWLVGKTIPGKVSNPEKLAGYGIEGTKTGDRVKVTYMGREGSREKFQINPSGSGKTSLVRVAGEDLRKK